MRQNLIVLTVDGLSARSLGPYGNTWVDTPSINALAAQGVLLENVIAERLEPGSCIRSLLSIRPETPIEPTRSANALRPTVSDLFTESVLVYDTPNSSQLHGVDVCFNSHVNVEIPTAGPLAADWSETHLAVMFAALTDRLEDLSTASHAGEGPFLAWCDSQTLLHRWDAPSSIAQEFGGPEDPAPFAGTTPPVDIVSPDNVDPDLLLSFNHAYAAQIIVLDRCLEALFNCLHEFNLANSTQILLTSSFGYPLGEHGIIGSGNECLFGEAIHVPFIVSQTEQRYQARRYQSVIQHSQLSRLLFAEPSLTIPKASTSPFAFDQLFSEVDKFPFAVTRHGSARAIQSPSWLLHDSPQGQSLFVKPDDRWEVNDVANLCHEVVKGLADLLERIVNLKDQSTPELPFDRSLISPTN